jgi:hypothetical protein
MHSELKSLSWRGCCCWWAGYLWFFGAEELNQVLKILVYSHDQYVVSPSLAERLVS